MEKKDNLELLEETIWKIRCGKETGDLMSSELVAAHDEVQTREWPECLFSGFNLVMTIAEMDRICLAMGDCCLYGVGTHTGNARAYTDALWYYLCYHTDHIAWWHLENYLDDRFEILFNKIKIIEGKTEGEETFFLNNCFARMYAEGLGCRPDLEKAKEYLARCTEYEKKHHDSCLLFDVRELIDIMDQKLEGKKPVDVKSKQRLEEGDFIYMGSYNHRPILWKAIACSGRQVLLLSVDALESSHTCIKQNGGGFIENAHWGDLDCFCDIPDSVRKDGFSIVELSAEQKTDNRFYTFDGNLFLLNADECQYLLPVESERTCYWRRQALANSTDNEECNDSTTADWYLSGLENGKHRFVNEDGKIQQTENWRMDLGLRPAMWILN